MQKEKGYDRVSKINGTITQTCNRSAVETEDDKQKGRAEICDPTMRLFQN